MSFRSTLIAASFALAAVPAAFAGPLSADGAPLTIDTPVVASQMSRDHARSTVQGGAVQGLVSADGSQLIVPAARTTEVTRAQVQAQARQQRSEQRASDALPLIGLNG